MKIKITAFMVIVTVVLGILCLTSYLFSDRIAPEITVPFADIVYEEGADMEVLLKGISAIDDVDGDISEEVRIYDIAVMADGENALVTYAVYDKSYNLAKAYKVVNYIPKQPVKDDEPGEEDAKTDVAFSDTQKVSTVTDAQEESANVKTKEKADKEDNSDKEKIEATDKDKTETTDKEETTGKDKKEATETADKETDCKDGYEDVPMVSDGAPVIRLRTHEITITVGGYFYSMDYVDTAVDDKDSKDALYNRMYMDGYYNTNKPGVYELTYYCVDSDDNPSNMAKLRMIVTEEGQ